MKVVELISQILVEDLGLNNFFGISGANIEDLIDVLERKRRSSHPEIKIILAKHEFGALTMADGHFRTSNKMAVVMSTSGGAALNIVAGLGEAFTSHIPMLVFVGAPSLAIEGNGAFQDSSGKGDSFSIMEIFKAVSCYAHKLIDPLETETVIVEAFEMAQKHQRPAVVVLPKNIQISESPLNRGSIKHRIPEIGNPVDPSFARRLLAYKGKLIFLLGAEASREKIPQELFSLVKQLDAKVLLTPEGKGAYPEKDSSFIGISGVMGEPISDLKNHLDHAAAICLIGTSGHFMERFGLEGFVKEKILFSISSLAPYFEAKKIIFHKTNNLKTSVVEILTSLEATITTSVSQEVAPFALDKNLKISINHLGELFSMIAMRSPANWFIDAGNVVCNVVRQLKMPMGSTFSIALGMGGMGHSFGAAIGGYLGNGLPTFVMSGDGAFYMHGMEIHTALEHELPICFFIGNNNGHAMCRSREILYYNIETTINKFNTTEIAKGLAAMFPKLVVFEINTIADFYECFEQISNPRQTMAVVFNLDINEVPDFGPFVDQAKKIKEQR